MTAQYTYDGDGNPIGVFIPINDWNEITEKYQDLVELPQWQKDAIDQRLDVIKNHPERIKPIDNFLSQLDKDAKL